MFLTTLALLALQTTPPAAAAPDPGADIRAKSAAFSTCIQGGVGRVPASATPEAGADQVLMTCKPAQTALEQAIEVQLHKAPPEMQATARQQVAAGFAQTRTRIIDSIRQSRAPKPAPTTSPKPAATPS